LFIIGASIGSFLNVLIDRLPKDESINDRSHCDYCGKKIAWYDLIPVFSFFILGGKTRCCHKKLSWQYPLVEIITGISFLLIFNFQFSIFNEFSIINFQTFILFGIVSCFIVIFFSDLKYHLISDYIQVAFFIFSIIYHLRSIISFSSFFHFFISSFVVAFPIWLIYFLSKERAMGLGDVFLALNIGFLLGWQAGFLALYIAFVTGAIFGLFLILLKRKKIKSKISFGPFLVIGTIIMLFYSNIVWEIISKIYRF
ncbi:MAG: prepilin peptidase, partial [Candidatus Roizmanbacteria bacterium]|nr:prepilin peptidase [Candidatus Roizmanbacteria bacterium]